MSMVNVDQRPMRHQRPSSRMVTLPDSTTKTNRDSRAPSEWARSTDAGTIAYIKRVLCQKSVQSDFLAGDDSDDRPLEELLPPLTSSNEIDVQLYAIIAVILNQFVQSWYSRFTPDGDFVAEIVQIIAHCTRGLEERLRHVDLETFVLHELPTLVDAHLSAVMMAREACLTPHGSFSSDDRPASIYHSLRPHYAMSPSPVDASSTLVQDQNETAWCRLVVTNIVPLLLPPEDLLNPCLSVLVVESFSDMIFHNALCGKLSEPWLLWEGVTKLLYTLRPNCRPPSSAPSPRNRLDEFGLLSSAGATREHRIRGSSPRTLDPAYRAFWSLLQYILLGWMLSRAFVTALMHASSLPVRPDDALDRNKLKGGNLPMADSEAVPSLPTDGSLPIVSMGAWACICRLTSLDQRMPWLTSLLSLLQWLSLYGPGQICRANGPLDRLVSSHLHTTLLDPAHLPALLHAIRVALLPDNALAPARAPPSPAQVLTIKRECARTLVAVLAPAVRRVYFATADEERMQADVERTLDLFGQPYLNKNLIVAVVEAVVGRLFPELLVDD